MPGPILSAVKNVVRYVLIAVAVVIAYALISPDSVLGWVLYIVIGAAAVVAVEAIYRRIVA